MTLELIRTLEDIKHCQLCASALAHSPRPVLRAAPSSRLLIIGQAPGRNVHETGVPWNDPSGKRLREWLQLTDAVFYNTHNVAIIPMGFCYPGKGKQGDLPPRPECAPKWHARVLQQLPNIELTLLIGQYAQQAYLPAPFRARHKNLTERVQHQNIESNSWIALPHPSPRNQYWLKKHPWFNENTVPALRHRIQALSL